MTNITPAAEKKLAILRGAALDSRYDVEFNITTPELVSATVHLTDHAAVTVTLQGDDCAAGEPAVSCSCQKPLDLGMPCKHAHRVFQALRTSEPSDLARVYCVSDARWYSPVWHTATWCEQYAEPYPPLQVRKHAANPMSTR